MLSVREPAGQKCPGDILEDDAGAGESYAFPIGRSRCYPTHGANAKKNQRRAYLMLCRLSAQHREIFELIKANRLFQVTSTEAEALRAATPLLTRWV